MKYYYPAIFCPAGEDIGGYELEFPDIPGCFTCGDDINECMWMAQDAIGLMLDDVEEKDYPEPSHILDIDLKNYDCPKGSFLSYVCFDKEKYDAAKNSLAKTAG